MSIQSPAMAALIEMTETLDVCPACDSSRVSVLHAELEDRLFGCPGKWSMWECHGCGVAFLNPRLTRDRIGEAYGAYYTHSAVSPRRTIRSVIRNTILKAYARRQLGRDSAPYLIWADWIVRYRLPMVPERLAAEYRYLPRPGRESALLDVGCGDGEFLRRAQFLGWRAVGLEFDPQACAVAAARKLNVIQGAVPDTGLPANSFDAVTLNHVIEHVHDPRAVLAELFRLVKPHGRIVLTTPNRHSFGADVFGRSWRGLEPPRHLVLFTPGALAKAVTDAGFVNPEVRVRTEANDFYFLQSYAIASSVRPDSVSLPPALTIQLETAKADAKRDPNRAEEFTVIATKPGAEI